MSELGESSIQYTHIEKYHTKKLHEFKLNIQRLKSANDNEIVLRGQLYWFDNSVKPMIADFTSNTMLIGKLEQFWEVHKNSDDKILLTLPFPLWIVAAGVRLRAYPNTNIKLAEIRENGQLTEIELKGSAFLPDSENQPEIIVLVVTMRATQASAKF